MAAATHYPGTPVRDAFFSSRKVRQHRPEAGRTSHIEHRTNVEHRTSDIEGSTSSTGRTSNIGHRTFNVEHRMNIEHRTSNAQRRALDEHRTNCDLSGCSRTDRSYVELSRLRGNTRLCGFNGVRSLTASSLPRHASWPQRTEYCSCLPRLPDLPMAAADIWRGTGPVAGRAFGGARERQGLCS